MENTNQFNGVYHVLGGLSPMDGVGPTDIKIEELINRVEENQLMKYPNLEYDYGRRYDYFYLFRRLKDMKINISVFQEVFCGR